MTFAFGMPSVFLELQQRPRVVRAKYNILLNTMQIHISLMTNGVIANLALLEFLANVTDELIFALLLPYICKLKTLYIKKIRIFSSSV